MEFKIGNFTVSLSAGVVKNSRENFYVILWEIE